MQKLMQKEADTMNCDSLNEFLEGLYMGIESFKSFEKKSKPETSIHALIHETSSMYHNQAALISDRIHDLGGEPKKSLSLMGRVAETMSEVKDIFVTNEDEIRNKAYTAAKKGIDMEEKFLKEHPDLDDESRTLIMGIIKESNMQLKKFN